MAFSTLPITNIIDLGFRSATIGALSADWSMIGTTTTPNDVAVKLDTENICWKPTVSANQTNIRNDGKATSAQYFRMFTSLRRVNSGGYQSEVGFNRFTGHPPILNIAIQSTDMQLTASGAVFIASVPSAANLWYRVAIEVLSNQALFYANPTGNANPNSILDPAALALQWTTNFNPSPLYAFVWGASNVGVAANDYSGVADIHFEILQPPQAGTTVPGGEGYPIPLAPYQRYKSVRAAVDKYNNLQLGP